MTGIELALPDRTVVVVGAGGGGIGSGVSALLVRSGATVLGLDVDRRRALDHARTRSGRGRRG